MHRKKVVDEEKEYSRKGKNWCEVEGDMHGTDVELGINSVNNFVSFRGLASREPTINAYYSISQ